MRVSALLTAICYFFPKSTCAFIFHALWWIRKCYLFGKGRMMYLTIRKIIVLGLIGIIFLVANVMVLANWLSNQGLIDWADNIRAEYLTGTAIAVIVTLLLLIVGPGQSSGRGVTLRRCPVCDRRLTGNPSYCSECGSKV